MAEVVSILFPSGMRLSSAVARAEQIGGLVLRASFDGEAPVLLAEMPDQATWNRLALAEYDREFVATVLEHAPRELRATGPSLASA